jgi:hypothetical protein
LPCSFGSRGRYSCEAVGEPACCCRWGATGKSGRFQEPVFDDSYLNFQQAGTAAATEVMAMGTAEELSRGKLQEDLAA